MPQELLLRGISWHKAARVSRSSEAMIPVLHADGMDLMTLCNLLV
jgi:hypothetical protein